MSMGESLRTVLGKYAEFSGRAPRPEFWWWVLFTALVSSALNLLAVLPVGEDSSVGAILAGLWGFAILLPTLAVAVRRLRDAGKSWAYLLFGLVPVAGIIIVAVLLAQPTAPAGQAARA